MMLNFISPKISRRARVRAGARARLLCDFNLIKLYYRHLRSLPVVHWIPAFAGMTEQVRMTEHL